MKVISFSAVEILPALLDRSKTQTLRPAWKDLINIGDKKGDEPTLLGQLYPEKMPYGEKKPRFKVGEKVKFMWKCRSPYKYFSPDDGRGVLKLKDGATWVYEPMIKVSNLFEKTLGTGTITEVFEIEMGIKKGEVKYSDRTEIREYQAIEGVGRQLFFNDRYVELPQMDGFKSTEELFRYFDKAYGLDSPKRFYVYRWRWDE